MKGSNPHCALGELIPKRIKLVRYFYHMSIVNLPLVSCIMPTANRRQFIPYAIRYFLGQDYPHKELIIIDDGADCIEDLVPKHNNIRYYRLLKRHNLGAKLNQACQHANGDFIAHWDDDDWYAPRRLSYQISALQQSGKAICGINQLLYFDLEKKRAYQYVYPKNQRPWLLGSSLCYKKALWEKLYFAEVNVGMDGLFLRATPPDQVKVLEDSNFSVFMIHSDNVSPKYTGDSWWQSFAVEDIQQIMEKDWDNYRNGNKKKPPKNGAQIKADTPLPRLPSTKTLKNVYACLVHEREDCIIDLVRNLHYHDPSSIIILYNGGKNPNLLQSDFPYEHFGALIYPRPKPQKHGYLHGFALDCMAFANQHFQFDTFTNIDSDQLGIRSGYSQYLASFLSAQSGIGMLCSVPDRISPHDTSNYVAQRAYKEVELWTPLLDQFPNGRDQFVHWTFWPSTVFTHEAVRDLLQLFKKDEHLKRIMKHTQIWATEEVIFPTLTKLLGYQIAANPCQYDYVKYKVTYSEQDIGDALSQNQAYWVHPILRLYGDPIRQYIRQQASHYVPKHQVNRSAKSTTAALFSPLALIKKVEQIEGWLTNKEAELLISIVQKTSIELSNPHTMVEIGSYQGKSTVVLGTVIKHFSPASKIYAIDPHEGLVGALDQGLDRLGASLQQFNKNIKEANLCSTVELIHDYSYRVHWSQSISLLFIDGLHDYPNVARDFWHFAAWVRTGGYVAFHDYAPYYPGVMAFVDELLTTKKYQKMHLADSLILLQKLS